MIRTFTMYIACYRCIFVGVNCRLIIYCVVGNFHEIKYSLFSWAS